MEARSNFISIFIGRYIGNYSNLERHERKKGFSVLKLHEIFSWFAGPVSGLEARNYLISLVSVFI